MIWLLLGVGIYLLGVLPLAAKPKPLVGPVPAFVERVIDGDTIDVRARIWLGQEIRVRVRIRGVDAPEMKARCPVERELAVRARDYVTRAIAQRKISLTNISQGKYAGRVIASVALDTGETLAHALIRLKLGRAYRKGRRTGWCSALNSRSQAPLRNQSRSH